MTTTFYNIEEQRFWDSANNWSDGGHEWSSAFGTTENLWNNWIFNDIKPFQGKTITEIAPGHGRITQFLSILAGKLTVIDLNPTCITATRQKLGNHVDRYLIGDGKSLAGIEDLSQDLIFSFDSFVHMHANVTAAYLQEAYRVLKPGGMAWIHHSCLGGNASELSFDNIAGRAAMDPTLFSNLALQAGLKVLEQRSIQFNPVGQWDGVDTISILIK